MKENICGIYCIENKINQKKYVGQSIDIYDRWYQHKYELDNNCHRNNHLQNAWNKYRSENFDFYILEVCDKSELDNKEIYWSELYNVYADDMGYALRTAGQNGNFRVSEETKIKMSQSHIGILGTEESRKKQSDKLKGQNNPMYGRRGELSPTYGIIKTSEQIQRMKDVRWTEEKRKKQSVEISGVNNPMYGKYGSENPESRAVICIETGEMFESIRLAAKWCNLKSTSMIGQVCLGNRKSAGKHPITGEKLHWKYVELIINHNESNEFVM
jgi:group I intron endonuclease